jgi:hypothetical protein
MFRIKGRPSRLITALRAAVLALSFPYLALADEDTSSISALKSLTEPTKKPLIERLREKVHISYWSTMAGPSLDSKVNQSVNGNGEAIAMGSFHMLWTGWRVNQRHTLGVLNRYSQDFTSTDDNGNRVSSTRSLRDPRIYWRMNGAVDNSWLNYSHEARVEIPTTERAERAGRKTTLQSVHIFNLKQKNKKFTPGVFFAATGVFNSVEPSALNLAIGPYANYLLSKKWSINAWTWFDLDQRFDRRFGALEGVGTIAEADYFRIGPMYSMFSNFQIFPSIQAYVFAPKLRTTTAALEMSIQL